MKAAFSTLLGLTFVFVAVAAITAADEKGKTLKGSITCAKCDLGKEKKCMTVIVTKEDGKDVVYYFDAKSNGKYHKDICKSAKKGTVTGDVSEKDGKKVVKVTDLKYD